MVIVVTENKECSGCHSRIAFRKQNPITKARMEYLFVNRPMRYRER